MFKGSIDFVLKNRLIVIAIGILVMAAGYSSYKQLPINAFPDVSPNLVQVFTVTEGLAPEDVEKYVTYPIEISMNGLPHLKKIRSVSNFGLSVVNIYFNEGTDIYFARRLVNERLQEAREQIPEGFGTPQLGPISTGMGLILFYYLKDETGKLSLEELRTLQDWVIKPYLQSIKGVTEVLGIGGYEKQYHVIIRPDDLLRYKLSLSEVVEKIKANNLNVGAQFIEKNREEYIVRSVALAYSKRDLEEIIIKSVDGTPIYLKQIADIKIGGAIRRGVQTRNGRHEVVAGMVVKLYGTNSSTVIARVQERLEKAGRLLPKGVKIVPYYEQKTLVEACVNTVRDALFSGIALVVIILMIFMGGIRASIVVALSLPFSILFATIWMKYLGMTANLMSLGGLAIAIGMMVDATIVIVENVDRFLRESPPNLSKLEVVRRASMEVVRPIAFAITIIIVVFIPLFALKGVEGKTFRPLAYSVALAMLGSLFFALFLAPVLASLLMTRPKRGGEDGPKTSLSEKIIQKLLWFYRPLVTWFVRRSGVAVALSAVLLAVGAAVFPLLGSEFTPRLYEGTIVLRLTMAPSISLKESTRLTMIVERRVMTVPEVKEVLSRIGRGEVGAHTDPVNSAEMYIILRDKSQWKEDLTQEEIVEKIRKKIADIPGILTNFTQPIEMTVDELLEGVRAELAIKLFGDDIETLKKGADAIAEKLRKVPGAVDIQVDQVTGTPQLLIKVNRQAIARYGINAEDVQETIRIAIGGTTAGQVFQGIRRFDIYVRYPYKDRKDRKAIENLLIQGPDGIHVPLSQLATIKEIIGPRQITREDNQRFITIQCNVRGRDIGSFVEDATKAMAPVIEKLPPGYFVTWGGKFRLQQEANARLMVVIPLTLLLIVLLLYLNFNSLSHTFLIMLNIPLALVGGVVALWISGQNLSVPSSVGFISLFGIALENGIVLITMLRQLQNEGMSVEQASIEAACLRLRPVLMTALTTGLGLLPLLFSTGTGSEVQRPLATVVTGGLFTSTVLTLLVVPAVYKWFSNK